MSVPSDSEPIFYVLVQPAGTTEKDRVDTTDIVLSVEFDEDEKKADELKLTLDNWDLEHFDNPLWRQGNIVIVTWGYPGKMAPPRTCIIQKVTGSIQITVTAQARSMLMNKDIKVKTYENARRSEIVHAIAKTYGFGDDQRHIEDTETFYEHIAQSRMSDAQFIKKLADAEHFEFYVDFSGLHWHPRRMGQKPLRVMQYYLPPDVGDIRTFDVESDPFHKPTQVTAKGRDPAAKQDVGGVGSDATTGRVVLASTIGVADGVETRVVQQADIRPTTETSSAQVKKEADGAFKRAAQVAVKLSLDCVGDPFVVAKSVLDIRGISKRLSGLYYVNSANHKIDASGYTMALKVTSDGTHGHSQDLLAVPKTATKSKATANPSKPGETQDPGATIPAVTIAKDTGVQTTTYSDKPRTSKD